MKKQDWTAFIAKSTIPAMKIAKLAVSTAFYERFKGIGSLMVEMAIQIAQSCNEQHFACRFITVDADIEHKTRIGTDNTDFRINSIF